MGSLFCSSKLIVFYFKQAQEGCFTEMTAMMVKEKRTKGTWTTSYLYSGRPPVTYGQRLDMMTGVVSI